VPILSKVYEMSVGNNLKIKVCGMRDQANLKAVCQAKPDFTGFIFYAKSKRYVGEEPDLALFASVAPGIRKVGVFVNESAVRVAQVCHANGLDAAQLHGDESSACCAELKRAGFMVLKAFSVGNTFDFSMLKPYESVVDYFLFDTKGKLPGGTGLKFDWSILQQYQGNVPFFLSGGIGPDDADAILNLSHPCLAGVDVNSGFELSPGIKDDRLVAGFIRQIRSAIE